MKKVQLLLIFCCCTLIKQQAFAQELFYQVYQFETPYQGHINLKSYDTYFAKSDESYEHFGKNIQDRHLYAHSFEAEFGVLDHLEIDAYADFEKPANGNFKFIQTHFSALYRIGERFDNFVNIALYGEYYIPQKSYSTSQEAELRLILDKDFGDFRIAANPYVGKYTTGDETKKLNPGISAGLYYRRLFAIQPGVEFYSDFNEQQDVIFPTLDVRFTPAITLNVGAGFGLSKASDDLLFKSILAFDIQAIRPSKLFHKPYHFLNS